MTRTAVVDRGAVLRAARAVKRATLEEVGSASGYSASAVSRILNGKMSAPDSALRLMAEFLEISPASLGLADDDTIPDSPTSVPAVRVATRVASPVRSAEVDVRRRDFLAAGAAGASVVALGSGRASAAAVPVVRADPLEDALFTPGAVEPVRGVAPALADARAAFRAARYDRLRTTLPSLIAGAEFLRDASTGTTRERAQVALARSYILATEVAVKGSADYAWVTADRALVAARASGSPVVVGEAARVLAITMRRSGRIGSAVQLLATTAADLEQAGRDRPDVLAVRTTLLLTAAYTAATGGNAGTAEDLVDEAERSAKLIPAGMTGELFTVEATADQVALYRIGLATALGNPDAGVDHARALNPALLPTRERQARFFTDTARMWSALGEDRLTYGALTAMERVAPEEVRRPSVQAVTAGLVHSAARLPGLRAFAARTGAFGA